MRVVFIRDNRSRGNLARWLAGQHPRYAQMIVERGPLDASAVATARFASGWTQMPVAEFERHQINLRVTVALHDMHMNWQVFICK